MYAVYTGARIRRCGGLEKRWPIDEEIITKTKNNFVVTDTDRILNFLQNLYSFGCRELEIVANGAEEARSWNLEARKWNLEAGRWILDAGRWCPGGSIR